MAAHKLPTPVADTLDDLRRIGRFLDYIADTAPSDNTHAVARAHAIKAWRAIEHVESMADMLEDFAAMLGDPTHSAAVSERKH